MPAADDPRLLINLGGEAGLAFESGERGTRMTLHPRGALVLPPGRVCQLDGPARLGLLTILHEFAHESRRRRDETGRFPGPSPEYALPQST